MDNSLFTALADFLTTVYNFIDNIQIPHTSLKLSTLIILPFGIMIISKCIHKLLDVGVSGSNVRTIKNNTHIEPVHNRIGF